MTDFNRGALLIVILIPDRGVSTDTEYQSHTSAVNLYENHRDCFSNTKPVIAVA